MPSNAANGPHVWFPGSRATRSAGPKVTSSHEGGRDGSTLHPHPPHRAAGRRRGGRPGAGHGVGTRCSRTCGAAAPSAPDSWLLGRRRDQRGAGPRGQGSPSRWGGDPVTLETWPLCLRQLTPSYLPSCLQAEGLGVRGSCPALLFRHQVEPHLTPQARQWLLLLVCFLAFKQNLLAACQRGWAVPPASGGPLPDFLLLQTPNDAPLPAL